MELYDQVKARIKNFLSSIKLLEINLLEILVHEPNIYIGGSFPSLCFVSAKPNDIDLYTKCSASTLRHFNAHNSFLEINSPVKTGVNITFKINGTNIPIQIITSEFVDFESDVLDEYDSNICKVGYHPATDTLIIHPEFEHGLANKKFKVICERSNPTRITKLTTRALELFNSSFEIIKDPNFQGTYRPYWKNRVQVQSINSLVPSPPYTQLYANKYSCVCCKSKSTFLVCSECKTKLNYKIDGWKLKQTNNKHKSIVVFGGIHGLGKIIADHAEAIGWECFRTGRNPSSEQLKSDKYFSFDLASSKPMNLKLLHVCTQADYIVFNAYQTLESKQSIWTTTLDTFDFNLAQERFEINCFGYVRLLQQIKKARIEYLSQGNFSDQIFVFMDANESKFSTKLLDGKHLELNMAKTACKQIFYTNAKVFAGLGVLTLCYDPGWLSYHGISVEQIESKSKFLIPPYLSAQALLIYLNQISQTQMQFYSRKEFIHDFSCYQMFDEILKTWSEDDAQSIISENNLDIINVQSVLNCNNLYNEIDEYSSEEEFVVPKRKVIKKKVSLELN